MSIAGRYLFGAGGYLIALFVGLAGVFALAGGLHPVQGVVLLALAAGIGWGTLRGIQGRRWAWVLVGAAGALWSVAAIWVISARLILLGVGAGLAAAAGALLLKRDQAQRRL